MATLYTGNTEVNYREQKCLRLDLFMANLKHTLNAKRKIENISVITEKYIFTLNITRKF